MRSMGSEPFKKFEMKKKIIVSRIDTKNTLKTKISGVWQCLRCGKEWRKLGNYRPKRCRHCRTPYWDVPRQVPMSSIKKLKESIKKNGNKKRMEKSKG